jgi:glutamate-1-semialdehyde 2,1-aminomutase
VSRTDTRKLYQAALEVIAGGVNSPVRAFKAVGGEPVFIARGKGSRMWSAQGREYLDYVQSWGAMILGHAHPRVVEAVKSAAEKGTSFGAPTEAETALASKICNAIPSIDKVRLVNSGTEAVMSAVRLARGVTKRDKIIKFAGCYHGHSDYLLVAAGSGGATFGVPDSAGVPCAFAQHTVVLPYNDLNAVRRTFDSDGAQIAAVIVEPVAANMGVVAPREGFLSLLRELCTEHRALLIFDEVITGFRLCFGTAQTVFGVRADLTCLGKIIGGGLPIGAYGASAEIMKHLAPEGPVYQAGTLSGNPVAVAAGIETLRVLEEENPYDAISRRAQILASGIARILKKVGRAACVNRVGSLLTVFFEVDAVTDYREARAASGKLFSRFFTEMLKRGVYLPPSAFEAWFISAAHSEADIERTLDGVEQAAGLLD